MDTTRMQERRDSMNAAARGDMDHAATLARDPAQRSAAAFYRRRATRRYAAADQWQRKIDCATIPVRAMDVEQGHVIVDGATYSVDGQSLAVESTDLIPADEFSTDPDGNVRFNFGPSHWLVVSANDVVRVVA